MSKCLKEWSVIRLPSINRQLTTSMNDLNKIAIRARYEKRFLSSFMLIFPEKDNPLRNNGVQFLRAKPRFTNEDQPPLHIQVLEEGVVVSVYNIFEPENAQDALQQELFGHLTESCDFHEITDDRQVVTLRRF